MGKIMYFMIKNTVSNLPSVKTVHLTNHFKLKINPSTNPGLKPGVAFGPRLRRELSRMLRPRVQGLY